MPDSDSIINQCLDLEAEGRDAESRALAASAQEKDPQFADKLLRTRAAVGQLRGLPQSPNMAPAVLAEVDYLRPFLSRRRRRQLSATRVAVAAGIVLTISIMAVLQRMYPEVAGTPEQPIGGVVEASRADAAESVKSMASAVDQLRAGVSRPVTQRANIWSSKLSMGDTSRYDSGTNWSKDLSLSPRAPGGSVPTAVAAAPSTSEPMLLLSHGVGLFDHAPTASMLPGLDPSAALLDLEGDGVLTKRGLIDFEKGKFHPAKPAVQ